ncbi:hypothetical protein H7F33_18065 [Pedobacter sp. PAMC26386]|nr:hypothetical protein H7F33_18065 [Pedobacter sp. PAMC26386]
MFKYLITLLCLFLTVQSFPVHAQQSFPVHTQKSVPVKVRPLKSDSSNLQLRNFDAQQIKRYKEQREFKYKETAAIDYSLWERFWAWFWSLFQSMTNTSYSIGFFRYVIIGAFIGLIVFVIIKFTGVDFRIFTGKSKVIAVPYAESVDNIHEIDFRVEIDKAIGSANYRLAVRLMYLRSLKKLNTLNLINWQPEKTNQTYIKEITDPHKREQFSLLTTQFEYIWYGEFFIDQENFNQVKSSYDQFNSETR